MLLGFFTRLYAWEDFEETEAVSPEFRNSRNKATRDHGGELFRSLLMGPQDEKDRTVMHSAVGWSFRESRKSETISALNP